MTRCSTRWENDPTSLSKLSKTGLFKLQQGKKEKVTIFNIEFTTIIQSEKFLEPLSTEILKISAFTYHSLMWKYKRGGKEVGSHTAAEHYNKQIGQPIRKWK